MMSLQQAATALQAELHQVADATHRFEGVVTDSRQSVDGQLFVALRGEHFDGHGFVAEVIGRGARAALVDRAWLAEQGDAAASLPLIVVADTRLALGQLAAWWRQQFAISVIGITGSNGKTTVKEMCAAVLRAQFGGEAQVLATQGNLNNDIGLPLTLLRLRAHHQAAVVEMGMNHVGEIAYLTRIAAPTVALVNNAQRAHLEGLGSLAGIARAKGEIFQGLAAGGVAVINSDDEQFSLWQQLASAQSRITQVTFGLNDDADVSARLCQSHLSSHVLLATPAGTAEFDLPVPGVHNVRNATAATAACLAAGVPLDTIVAALAAYAGVKGRLQQKPGLRGARVIDDTYNANPDSMRAAVDVLSTLPGKRVFVMGDMGEVGEGGGQFHDELGGYAKSMGVDRLFCYGELSPAAAHTFGEGGHHFTRMDELIRALKHEMDDHTTVLVKGSRFMRMERVVEAITATPAVGGKENHAA